MDSRPSWAMAVLACRPVLYMAIKAQGVTEITTIIIMRLKSMASRTCTRPVVVSSVV